MRSTDSKNDEGSLKGPLLQLALDITTIDEAKAILEEVKDFIDIIEIGTPFILRYGIEPIREIKRSYPLSTILADFKIADAGEYESRLAFDAGADIVTLLAAAPDSTIKTVIRQAEIDHKSIMIDTVGLDDIGKRVSEIDQMGVHYICAHTGLDEQIIGVSTLANLSKVKDHTRHAKVAVAGGISLSNLDAILEKKPDIVIIGSSITSAVDRKNMAIKIKKIIDRQKGL